MKAKSKITVKQILNIERHARRVVDIELYISKPRTVIHKSDKAYSRKTRFVYDY